MKVAPYTIRLLLYFLIAYLLYIRLRLVFSYSIDLDGLEYVFVHYVQLLLQGKSLYQNPAQFPFATDIYTPGYSYMLYYVAQLFKWDYINNIHEILVAGRSIAFLLMLLNIWFVYKCLEQVKVIRSWILPLIALYLLLITGHFYAVRPDAVKTTLFTVIFFTLLRYLFFEGSIISLIGFNLAVIISVLFKHDAIINIFLVSGLFWLALRNKRATIVLITSGVSTILVFAGLYYTFGKYFFTNILIVNFQHNTDVAHSYNLWVMLSSGLRLLPLLIPAIYSCYLLFRKREGINSSYYIPPVAVICFVVAHVLMLRTGSYLNYSFEPSFLLILSMGILITEYQQLLEKYLKLIAGIIGCYMPALFVTNSIIHSYSFNSSDEQKYRQEYFSLLQHRRELINVIQDGPSFFPNSKYMDFYADQPMIYGHDLHMDRFIELYLGFKVSSRQVFLTSDLYDRYFETGQVPYIVVTDDELNIRHVKKYYPHYQYYRVVNNFRIYKYVL